MKETWSAWIYEKVFSPQYYENIRSDILGIFEISFQHPEAQSYREQIDPSDLQKQAITAYKRDPNFPSSNQLRNAKILFKRVYWFIIVSCIVVFLVSAKLSYDSVQKLSLSIWQSLSLFDILQLSSIIPTTGIAWIFLYIILLKTNRHFKRWIKEDLGISPAEIKRERRSANESKLFSYIIWNKLVGGARLQIVLSILYIINMISENVYGYIMATIEGNIGVFFEKRGVISTIYAIYRS